MTPPVSVVDDHVSVLRSLDRLIRSGRMEVSVFASAEEFLNPAHPRKADCLILDVRLPGMSGTSFSRQFFVCESAEPLPCWHGNPSLKELSYAKQTSG